MRHLQPLAGNPQTLEPLARRYQDVARYLDEAAVGLGRIANSSVFISEAIDATRAEALSAAHETRKIYTRYVGTADALVEYAVALEPIQARANVAITAHDNAAADIIGWRRIRDDYVADAMWAPEADREALLERAKDADRRVDDAVVDLAAAERAYDRAVEDYDAAAETARHKIDDAVVASDLNDDLFDNIGGWFAPFVVWLHDVCSALASALSWIALVLAVLACFFPLLAPFAAFVKTLSLITLVIAALTSLCLLVMGKQTLGDFIKDGISLGIAFLTKGKLKPIDGVGKNMMKFLNFGGTASGTAIGNAFNRLTGAVPDALGVTGDAGALARALQSATTTAVKTGINGSPEFGINGLIDALPCADVTFFGESEPATGPLWTRPDSIEIPTIDPATFEIPDVMDIHFDSMQSAIDVGEFRLQGFATAAR